MTRRQGLLIACCVIGLGAARPDTGLDVGQRPPNFSATDLQGQAHTLDDYQGKTLVLHFWASWCPYCRSEIPSLTELHQAAASKDVAVLTVSVDENMEVLRRFVKRQALPYPIIADIEAAPSVAADYDVSGLPTTYIIARDGRIAATWSGAGQLLDEVNDALSQSH